MDVVHNRNPRLFSMEGMSLWVDNSIIPIQYIHTSFSCNGNYMHKTHRIKDDRMENSRKGRRIGNNLR